MWVAKILFVQFSIFLTPVLNIFCFCYVLTISVLYQTQFAWNLLLVCLIFLTRSLVFPILLFSSISLHWSLGKAFLFLLAIFFWNSAFKWEYLSFSPLLFILFFSQLFVRPPQTGILLFFISFPSGWSWSLSPAQCHEPPSIVHQALCLSDLVPWIYFLLPLYHKGFDLGHTWMVYRFSLHSSI